MAYHQMITFDSQGNCIGSNYMDYMIPTAWETPHFELYEVVTPRPTTRSGARASGSVAPWVARRLRERRRRRHRPPWCAQHRHALPVGRVWEAIKFKKDVSGTPPLPGQ